MRARSVVWLVAVVSLTACVAPARTAPSYRDKAVDTAEAVVSAARTVVLAARAGADGGAFAPNVAVLVADAEGDASAAVDAFVSIQPPDAASDRLRAELLDDVQHAVDAIALARIAARRASLDGLPEVVEPLEAVADRLDRFAERYG